MANVGPLPRVVSLVDDERRPLRKTFPASIAHVGLLSAVHPLVEGEIALFGKTFAANGTRVGLVPGVNSYVLLEMLRTGQALAAHLAQHRVLPGVPPDVQHQTLLVGEPLVTNVALVGGRRDRLHIRMHVLLVGDEVPGVGEALEADLALEGHRPRVEILVLLVPSRRGEAPIAHLAPVLELVLVFVLQVGAQRLQMPSAESAQYTPVHLVRGVDVVVVDAQLVRVLEELVAVIAGEVLLSVLVLHVSFVALQRGEVGQAHRTEEVVAAGVVPQTQTLGLVLVELVVLDQGLFVLFDVRADHAGPLDALVLLDRALLAPASGRFRVGVNEGVLVRGLFRSRLHLGEGF